MRWLNGMLIVLVVVGLILSTGCAKRQTVEKTPAVEEQGQTMVEEPTPEPTQVAEEMMKYVVKKGDTLWDISAKDDIYGDPFQWPLLFKANRDQIEDPDIIEVDQELDVRKDFSREEIEDAIQKAKDTPPYVPHTKPRKVLPLKY